MSSSVSGADNTRRRDYFDKSKKREQDEEARRNKNGKELPVPKNPLKQREFDVDLECRLGKTQIVTQITPLNQQAGYFCKVCDCIVKDSANYLDHINGKKHQRALGMNMRVERSTLEQVQNRLVNGKRKATEEDIGKEIELRLLKQQEDEEDEKKRRKKERKKEKKREKAAENVEEPDIEVAEAMGFGGFGTTKK